MSPRSTLPAPLVARLTLALALVGAGAGIASAQVATLYTNVGYGGSVSTSPGGDLATLPTGIIRLDNAVSSIRILQGQPIAVYDGASFTGACTTIWRDAPDLGALGIDDTISSVRVAWTCEGGAWDPDACAAAPCGTAAECADLPRPAPPTAAGRTCRLPTAAPDLARGAAARQSSTGYGGVAARATDGNLDGVFNAGSVTSTTGEANAWLEIDLGAPRALGTVTVYNRTDCCSERLAGARLELSSVRCDAPRAAVFVAEPFDSGHVQARLVPDGVSARYLCVRQPAAVILSVAEITAFAPEARRFGWRDEAWGACSLACGGGVQGRAVSCRDDGGITAPDDACAGVAPPRTRACNTHACPAWGWSPWSACSGALPTRTRTAACVAAKGGAPLAELVCAALGGKPAAQSEPCPTPYWGFTEWSACAPASPGEPVGQRTRSPVCLDGATHTPVAEPQCAATSKPAAATEACSTAAWRPSSAWSACSAPLNGVQRRPYECVDTTTGAPLAVAVCQGSKPIDETRACNVFAWRAAAWGACSQACGGGSQARVVTCASETGASGPEAYCSGGRPSSEQACNLDPCP